MSVNTSARPDHRTRFGVEVSLGSSRDIAVEIEALGALAAEVEGDAQRAIALLPRIAAAVSGPGAGSTADRWAVLATLAAVDLTVARVAEAHLDALAILAEASAIFPTDDLAALEIGRDSTWGVFAAEGPGVRLQAEEVHSPGERTWALTGTKPWCSLAGRLTHALITAHTSPGHRRLFAVWLEDPSVQVTRGTWVSRGLRSVESGPIDLHGTMAVPVGGDEWYLQRSGFAWGGAGVAACWYGGAVGLARSLFTALSAREPDQIGQMHLGAVDLALHSCRQVLAAAAHDIDHGRADGVVGVTLAARVRGLVAGASEEILTRVGHTLGPAPLTQDESHARRVADLLVYLRQDHGERDRAALGRAVLEGELPW